MLAAVADERDRAVVWKVGGSDGRLVLHTSSPDMVIYEIQSDIAAIENNSALYEETNFDSRAEAIDYIEFNIIDRIEGLLQTIHSPEELIPLKQSAERLKHHLENI